MPRINITTCNQQHHALRLPKFESVYLAVGHAAALKPAVEHVVDAPQQALALAAGDGDVVDEVPVQVVNLHKKINKREHM
jgi:hypothetical protein